MNLVNIPLHAIRHGRIGGVESAIYNLVRGMHEISQPLALAGSRDDRLSPEFLAWTKAAGLPIRHTPAFGERIAARFIEETLYATRPATGSILFPNYFLPPTARRHVQNSVLIHDYQYRALPWNFSAGKRRWLEWCYKRALRHADRIFFISEFEKSQAMRYHGAGWVDRAHVIYNAIDWDRYGAELVEPTAHDRPYVLSVAHQHPHKNVAKLIEAVLVPGGPCRDHDLVLVGTPSPEVAALAANAARDARNRIVFTGFVSDERLGELYRGASAFALASHYEGFGMPAVEALGFGLNIVVSNSTALPEVTLGLGCYVAPDAHAIEWAEQIGLAIDTPRPASSAITAVRDRYSPVSVARRVERALR